MCDRELIYGLNFCFSWESSSYVNTALLVAAAAVICLCIHAPFPFCTTVKGLRVRVWSGQSSGWLFSSSKVELVLLDEVCVQISSIIVSETVLMARQEANGSPFVGSVLIVRLRNIPHSVVSHGFAIRLVLSMSVNMLDYISRYTMYGKRFEHLEDVVSSLWPGVGRVVIMECYVDGESVNYKQPP